jgi:hypothetical protein
LIDWKYGNDLHLGWFPCTFSIIIIEGERLLIVECSSSVGLFLLGKQMNSLRLRNLPTLSIKNHKNPIVFDKCFDWEEELIIKIISIIIRLSDDRLPSTPVKVNHF